MDPSLSVAELVSWVSPANTVLGARTRRDVRAQNLLHRATYNFLHEARTGALFVHRRAARKDYCPSHWDVAPGGVVQFGETYAENAERELAEEMGVRGARIEPCFPVLLEDAHARCWGGVFRCVWEGGSLAAVRAQPEEVEEVCLMTVDEVLRDARNGGRWTPDGLRALEVYAAWCVQRDCAAVRQVLRAGRERGRSRVRLSRRRGRIRAIVVRRASLGPQGVRAVLRVAFGDVMWICELCGGTAEQEPGRFVPPSPPSDRTLAPLQARPRSSRVAACVHEPARFYPLPLTSAYPNLPPLPSSPTCSRVVTSALHSAAPPLRLPPSIPAVR